MRVPMIQFLGWVAYLGVSVVISTVIGLLLWQLTRTGQRSSRWAAWVLFGLWLLAAGVFVWAAVVGMMFDVTGFCLPPARLVGSICDLPPV